MARANTDKYIHIGLLVIRIGIGIMFMVHGFPKLEGGPAQWEALGGSLSAFGITFLPVFWGFMAAISEFIGGLLIAIGVLFRPAAALLFITMMVAFFIHYFADDGFGGYSHALEAAILFLGLFLTGPGKYRPDNL
ncbi:MAG: DoxX family protein [Bacteroidota bacterium]|nr:DoxX family protein [Bacteroidota bacterium]